MLRRSCRAGRVFIGYPVFFGMIIDSTLGLLVIPVLYVAFQTMREKIGTRFLRTTVRT